MTDKEQYWADVIGKFLSGNASDEEKISLREWKEATPGNIAFFNELRSIWEITRADETIEIPDIDKRWSAVQGAINNKTGKRRRLYVALAAAAAVVLLALAILPELFIDQTTTQPQFAHIVAAGEGPTVHVLPDSSRVWLRDGSSLRYDTAFDQRSVELSGEAFFEVARDPDRVFTVEIGGAMARVLGTKFNLKQLENGNVELMVTEGKVAFGAQEIPAEDEVLVRNQAAVLMLESTQIKRLEQPVRNRMSWRSNLLVFNHVAMGDVLSDLKEHYGNTFAVEDEQMLNCTLKADFANRGLDEIIETIEFTLNWQFIQNGSGYRISGTPCLNDVE